MSRSSRPTTASMWRRVPGWRSSSAALTSRVGRRHGQRSWSKNPLVGSSSSSSDDCSGDRADRQALAPGADRLLQLVEQDLEAAEALVEEVLGLVAQPAGVGLGRLHHLAGPLLGGPHDLGALHHPLGPHPRRLEQLVGLAAGLGDELLALLEHPAGLAQLVGQALQRLLEQLDDLVAVDPRRRRQRHRRRRGDDVDRAAQQRLGIADVALARLGVLVVDLVVLVVLLVSS